MTQHDKKNWTKPMLIVLTRTTPQEAVLCHCKYVTPTDSKGPKGKYCNSYNKGGNCKDNTNQS